jgi:endonuclease/exonuclease/phosphatase family metal-dependent hydrolase
LASSFVTMEDTKEPKKFSLLTFNTLGTPFFAPDILKRDNKIAELLNNASSDVICLQEIFTYVQFFIFKKKLTRYRYCVYQKNPFGPRGGLVIFSKHPLSDKTVYTYSYPKDAPVPFYTSLAQPGMLSAICQPFGIRVVTTHLSSDNVHDLTPVNRLYPLIQSQSQEAATQINQLKKKSEPVIVAGDFNIAKGSALYKAFLQKTEFSDAYADEVSPTYDPQRVKFFYRAPADRCDFIFIDKRRKNIKIDTLSYAMSKQETLSNSKKSYLSDHIALHCILEVNK